MENLQDYIKNSSLLNRHEADALEVLREKYPYFQALHILIAKAHKNQNTFGFNKNLKLASLYAGDRKVLYSFLNSEPPLILNEGAEKEEMIVSKPEKEETHPRVEELEKQMVKVEIKTPIVVDRVLENDLSIESTISLEIKENEVEHVEPLESEIKERVETETPIETKHEEIPVAFTEENDEEVFIEPNVVVELKEHDQSNTFEARIETKDNEVQPEEFQPIELPRKENELEPTLSKKEQDKVGQDFYDWLDKFVETVPAVSKETTPKEDSMAEEDKLILTPELHEPQILPLEVVSNEAVKNYQEPEGSYTEENDLDEEDDVNYDPAGWAEIAYDIQAYVKHPPENKSKGDEPKKVTKSEIDDLLDKFIKKNPSITRRKVEFFKPENMARKSEEFHAEVASETLAGLFYKQGLLHQSLEIYEKLMLQSPDKRDIFAARIKSIKEELINRL